MAPIDRIDLESRRSFGLVRTDRRCCYRHASVTAEADTFESQDLAELTTVAGGRASARPADGS